MNKTKVHVLIFLTHFMHLINAQNVEHITQFFTLFVSVHKPSRSLAGTRDVFNPYRTNVENRVSS